ncbi:caspase family protein [Carnobacterium maltaromaticum]|uniref:caspase family protein n=1 Tax=Carnobacterium maltaromaticum TaxID=2751 RepID=UPI0039BDD7B9
MPIKALVVGVSDYSTINQSNLPFCANDILVVSKALINGLAVAKENITALGDTGVVTTSDFIEALRSMIDNIKEDDTFILYFSGHGGNLPDEHHLLFSDNVIKTQEIIEILDSINAKNKLILLDSCMSGNFKVEETAIYSSDEDIFDFFGKGYAIISSSNATQYSWGHPEKPISLFTSFLCESLTDKLLIKKGNKSLSDIQKLLFLYLDIWNKNNPNTVQKPNFRANIGGTILFPVEQYTPYQSMAYYDEADDYIIYAVDDLHSSIAKRYSVKVILKNPLSFKEISNINKEIVKKVRGLEIYRNKNSENKWKNKLANIVFCYFGRDEFDITNSNFLCHTTWVDESQDKNHWYRKVKHCEIINDVHFNYHTYYNSLKIFQEKNTGDSNSLILQTKEIISNLISLSEKVISIYNEFLNETKTEDDFISELNKLTPELNKWYFAELELDIPPKELAKWCSTCTGLAATIHDFTMFYNTHGLTTRTFDNRIACMNITKDRYYEDLNKLKIEEQLINSLLHSRQV